MCEEVDLVEQMFDDLLGAEAHCVSYGGNRVGWVNELADVCVVNVLAMQKELGSLPLGSFLEDPDIFSSEDRKLLNRLKVPDLYLPFPPSKFE